MPLIFVFILIVFLGFLTVSFWREEFPHFLERLALGFFLGIGITTFILFILGIFQTPLTFDNLLLFLIFSIFVLGILGLNYQKFKLFSSSRLLSKITQVEVILIALILFFVFLSFLQTTYWPISAWDSLALYDFRGQRIAETHSLAGSALYQKESANMISYNYSYPFFTSMAHAIVYLAGGTNPQFIYSFAYLSLILAFVYLLRRRVSRFLALVFALVLSTTSGILGSSTVAYTNLFYSAYFSLGTIYFWEWFSEKKYGYLVISALFLGLSTWVRGDVFWVVNIFFVTIVLTYKRLFLPLAVYLLIFFAIREPWIFYRSMIFQKFDFPDTQIIALTFSQEKILPVLSYVFRYSLWPLRVPMALLLLILIFARKKVLELWFVTIMIASYFGVVFVGTYFFSLHFEWWNRIGDSLRRFTMFFPILIYYFSCLCFFTHDQAKKGKKRSKQFIRLFKSWWIK